MKAKIKYLIAGLAAFLTCTAVNAQVAVGLEGEFTTSSVKVSDINTSLLNAINGNGITGYEIGPYLKLGLGSIYIKPKVLVSYESGIVQAIYPDQYSAGVDLNVIKLDIPVLVGVKIIGPLSIEAGPVYNRIIYSTSDFNGNTVNIAPDGLGYRIGANAQFGFIGLNVGYQGLWNNSNGNYSSFATPDELIFGVSLGF